MDGDGTPLPSRTNWIHELNLDPRHRVAGGFGGDVIRKYQEDYMEAAWLQVGDVLAHNQKARVAKTWVVVTDAVHAKSIAALAPTPTRLLSLTAPLQARVLTGGVTLEFARQQSVTPTALTSPMMRRIARPGGPLARKLDLASGPHATTMLEAVNAGTITAAPPRGLRRASPRLRTSPGPAPPTPPRFRRNGRSRWSAARPGCPSGCCSPHCC